MVSAIYCLAIVASTNSCLIICIPRVNSNPSNLGAGLNFLSSGRLDLLRNAHICVVCYKVPTVERDTVLMRCCPH